jgi:hypothetical protein
VSGRVGAQGSVTLLDSAASIPALGPLCKRESHLWARDPLDWYVEPSWLSERLFATVPFITEILDPACGCGRIVQAARRAHLSAMGADIVDRGLPGTIVSDFFEWREPVGNIVCNPPFAVAEQFVAHALTIARQQVAPGDLAGPRARRGAADRLAPEGR